MTTAFQLQDDSQLANTFKKLATTLSLLLRREGIYNPAFHPGTPHFNAMPRHQKEYVLQHLEFYNSLCMEHQAEQQSLRDSQKFTWRALKKFGIAPPADLLNRISSKNVVEIYSTDHIQIFRNFEFFDCCSYTLEDLFCLEWWRLFQRDAAINDALTKMSQELLAGRAPEGFFQPLPRHTVIEALAPERFHIDFFMQHLLPLYKNKHVEAVISIVDAEVLE
jgi:hypothetical protein